MMKYFEIKSRDNILRGMVHVSNASEPIPVIICHGYFSASKIGPQRLFVEMGEHLSKLGFDVYRFDLSGMGESDGSIDEITFNEHVDDLRNIIHYVKDLYPNKKICLIAHCLGCSYALVNVLEKDDIYREIVFLAPFYSNEKILKNFFVKEESLKELENLSFTMRKGLYAHKSFFESNPQEAFMERINAVKVTIDVIIPTNDQFIPIEDNKKTFENAKFANVKYLSGADHNFTEHKAKLILKIGELLTDGKFTL